MSVGRTMGKTLTCWRCGKVGHKKNECGMAGGKLNSNRDHYEEINLLDQYSPFVYVVAVINGNRIKGIVDSGAIER